MKPDFLRLPLALALGSSLGACALFSKQHAQIPRYFTPDLGDHAVAAAPANGLRLRLGRVTAASNLREPIAYRASAHEIRYYENRRWTERPDAYLEVALARSLFEDHGVTMVTSGSAPTLQVELTVFEEILGPPHRVRAEITMVLHADGVARAHETFRVEESVPAVDKLKAPEAMVQAMSKALQVLVERVAQRSLVALSVAQAPIAPP